MLYEMNHFHKASTLIINGSQGYVSINLVISSIFLI